MMFLGNMRTAMSWGIVLLFVSVFVQASVASGVAQEQETEDVIITVDSTNLRFSPDTVTVAEGDTVRFFWSGQASPIMRLKQTSYSIRAIHSGMSIIHLLLRSG